MNKINKFLPVIVVAFGFLFSSHSCIESDEYCGYYFSIENNDNDTIYVYDIFPSLASGKHYELTVKEVFRTPKSIEAIPPHARFEYVKMGNFSIYDLEKGVLSAESNWVHHILVFRNETWKKYTKEELIENNIYDAYYVIAAQKIIDMGYVVPYPLENRDKYEE